MKKRLALLALATACTPALAVEQPYLGLDYQLTTFEGSAAGGSDYEVGSLQLRGGTMLTKYLGLEAQVAGGLEDDVQAGTELELVGAYSLMAVGRLPMGRGGVYVYAGYSFIDVAISSAATGSLREQEDGLGYGIGLDVPFFWSTSIEVDYKQLLDENTYNVTGMSAGIRKTF